MAHMVLVMATNVDQVLNSWKRRKKKQKPMGSRQWYKIGRLFC
jgi:hypothetical protein